MLLIREYFQIADKENYRPVSVSSKVFERLLYDKHSQCLEKYLTCYYAVFGKLILLNLLLLSIARRVR